MTAEIIKICKRKCLDYSRCSAHVVLSFQGDAGSESQILPLAPSDTLGPPYGHSCSPRHLSCPGASSPAHSLIQAMGLAVGLTHLLL